jgi:tetratricopeptide (TPR) repeat protein
MKRVLLASLIVCLASVYAFGQKQKVQAAYNYYKEPYQQYDNAKQAIDEAVLNEQSKGMPQAWYYRGLIYTSLYKNDKYGQLCDNCLFTAYESFQKALELDPKNKWADEITTIRIPFLLNKVFTDGIEKFQAKDYDHALQSFEAAQKMSPGDTACILNAAYSAERAGQTAKAIQYYEQLIAMKYRDENIYLSLSNLYKHSGETDKALNIIRQGRALFPDNMNLMLGEINILLSTGRNAEATKALDAAIAKDPNNQSLYLALGSTYDNLANPKDAAGNDLPKAPNYTEYVEKAEEAYKKGLAINPDNYELNFNLGALYFNQAAEMANKANGIKSMDEYAKAKTAFDKKFKDAEPFLEKALQLNPMKTEDDKATYNGTLNSLKQLYARTGETEKYNMVKEKLDAIH